MAHSCAEVGAGDEAEAADEGRAEIADDVAVEIFKQQRVVLVGIHDKLHAGVVDDVLAVINLGKSFGHFAGAAQKEAVGQLHDVGFVDGVNLFAAVLAGVFEGKLARCGSSLFR